MREDLPTLVLFPGLATDSRIYARQAALRCPTQMLEWIEAESPRETLSHYAQRMTSQIRKPGQCLLGGISLGAMVALDASQWADVRGTLLISGCRTHKQIAPAFRTMLAAGAMLPCRFIRPILALSPLALRVFERLDKNQRELMRKMFLDHSSAHIRWSCRAILEWEYHAPQTSAPVFSIHGENDEIIPLRNVPVQEVIPNGHHLINLSHPDQVNRFLARQVEFCSAK